MREEIRCKVRAFPDRETVARNRHTFWNLPDGGVAQLFVVEFSVSGNHPDTLDNLMSIQRRKSLNQLAHDIAMHRIYGNWWLGDTLSCKLYEREPVLLNGNNRRVADLTGSIDDLVREKMREIAPLPNHIPLTDAYAFDERAYREGTA